MQLDRGDVHAQYPHVLNYYGIYARMVEIRDKFLHLFQFSFVDDGVDRHIDLGSVDMGEIHSAADVVDAVGGVASGSMAGASHIDGVGTVQYGLHCYVMAARWCEQFKFSAVVSHFFIIRSSMRLSSRSFIDWRLSYCFLPRATPIRSLA